MFPGSYLIHIAYKVTYSKNAPQFSKHRLLNSEWVFGHIIQSFYDSPDGFYLGTNNGPTSYHKLFIKHSEIKIGRNAAFVFIFKCLFVSTKQTELSVNSRATRSSELKLTIYYAFFVVLIGIVFFWVGLICQVLKWKPFFKIHIDPLKLIVTMIAIVAYIILIGLCNTRRLKSL